MENSIPPSSIFSNTEKAYQHLTDSSLNKSFRLFKLMNFSFLVSIGNTLIQWALNVNLPIEPIIKKTIFKQFCGGESLEETKSTIDALAKSNIETLLNYSVEGLSSATGFKDTFEKTLAAIQFAKENPNIRAVCTKFTGFASTELWVKKQQNIEFTKSENKEFEQALKYISQLSHSAVENNVHLYIDAEESWFQDAIDEVCLAQMRIHNRSEAFIFNTYQLYRSDKLSHLKRDIEMAKKEGFVLGAKIVRGAYVEKEANYAQQHNTPNPIHKSKEATDKDFDSAIELCIKNLDSVSLCCASHNEYSNEKLLNLMQSLNIPLNHPRVCGSQLLGMSDNITYNLADFGVRMSKYVPYGPVREVVPYLIRRSQENTSVEGQTSREYNLLKIEKTRRNQKKKENEF